MLGRPGSIGETRGSTLHPISYTGLSPGAGDHLKTLDSCTATGFCCGRPRKSLGMSSPRSRTPAEPFVSCWAASACRSLHEQTALHDEALCCCSLCLLLAGRCSLFAGSLMSCWLKAKTCCACCCGAAVPHAAFMLPCCTLRCACELCASPRGSAQLSVFTF